VGHPKNVSIHSNSVNVKGIAGHYISCFSTYPGQSLKSLNITRDLSIKLLYQNLTGCNNISTLGFIKSTAFYMRFQLFRFKGCKIFWSREFFKKAWGYLIDLSISTLSRKYSSN